MGALREGAQGATNGGHSYSMAKRVREEMGRCERKIRAVIAREKREKCCKNPEELRDFILLEELSSRRGAGWREGG